MSPEVFVFMGGTPWAHRARQILEDDPFCQDFLIESESWANNGVLMNS